MRYASAHGVMQLECHAFPPVLPSRSQAPKLPLLSGQQLVLSPPFSLVSVAESLGGPFFPLPVLLFFFGEYW